MTSALATATLLATALASPGTGARLTAIRTPAPPPAFSSAQWDSLRSAARYDSLVQALGRRPDAPRVKRPLHGGTGSLDDVGRAFCRAIHHSEVDSLYGLCVSEREFAEILWPEFPQSRPVTGLAAGDAWAFLWPRNASGIRSAVGDHAGRYLEFLRFERRVAPASYRNFRLHGGLVLVARNERAEEESFDFLRTVVERRGRFKIYSMRD